MFCFIRQLLEPLHQNWVNVGVFRRTKDVDNVFCRKSVLVNDLLFDIGVRQQSSGFLP